MEVRLFLAALSDIATSPYALVGYVLVVVAWLFSSWQAKRLQVIGDRLKDLPEKDRLKALQLEYRLMPKDGLDAQSYLQLRATQFKFIALLAIILVVLLIACLATYKTIEDSKLNSSLKAATTALDITRLGRTRFNDQSYAEAAGNLEGALKTFPTAAGYLNLGYIYEEISKTDAAIIAYTRALELQPKSLVALNNLGMLYKDSGKFEQSLLHLKTVIGDTKRGDELWFHAMINSGTVHYEIGRASNNAEKRETQCKIAIDEFYLPALEFQGAIVDRDFAARGLSNLANCYKDTGQFELARKALEESLSIKRKIAANRSLAETLVNLADLKLKQAKYSEAKPDLLDAIGIFRLLDNQIGLGAAYFNLGDIAWTEANTDDARDYYSKSVEYFKQSNAGGEYAQAPARRLDRLSRNDLPSFIKAALDQRNKREGGGVVK